MANVSTRSFSDLIRISSTAIQASSAKLVDFSIGSVLRAIIEAYAQVALWLQSLAIQILATTRASTSTGTDLDSWMADFGVTRRAAAGASGAVTFSRLTSTGQISIPVGATVASADGSQQFAVIANVANAAFSPGLNAYVMAAGVSSVLASVAAATPGQNSNVAAGVVSVITSAIPGVDSVTNLLPFSGGSDAEWDADFRARFVSYLASLSKATSQAIGFAITNVQAGLSYTIIENETYDGIVRRGHFSVIVDDGSGAAPPGVVSLVGLAVEQVRAIGVSFSVNAAVTVSVTIGMTISLRSGYATSTADAAIRAALNAYLATLPIGQTLSITKLAQLAWDATAGISNVSAITINGASTDLAVTTRQIIRPAIINLTFA